MKASRRRRPALGTVLHRNGSGKHWQAVLQDPRIGALRALEHQEGIFDFAEKTLTLEDIYCALLAGKAEAP